MNRFARIAALALVVVFAVMIVPAMAQQPGQTNAPAFSINLTPSLGVGLVVIGAAMGISRLAAAAYESMARQPEVAGTINTAMIIAAALIEGFTFFALFIFFQGIAGG